MTARTPEEQRRFEEQGRALDELTREFYEAGHYDIPEDWLRDNGYEPPQSTERGAKHDR